MSSVVSLLLFLILTDLKQGKSESGCIVEHLLPWVWWAFMTNRELSLTLRPSGAPLFLLLSHRGCFEGSSSVCVDEVTLKVMQHQLLTELCSYKPAAAVFEWEGMRKRPFVFSLCCISYSTLAQLHKHWRSCSHCDWNWTLFTAVISARN